MTTKGPDDISSPADLLRERVHLALVTGRLPARVELGGFGETVREMVRTQLGERGFTVRHITREVHDERSDGGGYYVGVRDYWLIHAAT
jgi:hypothetical protein